MSKNIYVVYDKGEHRTYESAVDALLPHVGGTFTSWDDVRRELDVTSLHAHLELLDRHDYLESEDGTVRVFKTTLNTTPDILVETAPYEILESVVDGDRGRVDTGLTITEGRTLQGENCYALSANNIPVLIGVTSLQHLFNYSGQTIEVHSFKQLRGDSSTKQITTLAVTYEQDTTIFSFRDKNDRSLFAFYGQRATA